MCTTLNRLFISFRARLFLATYARLFVNSVLCIDCCQTKFNLFTECKVQNHPISFECEEKWFLTHSNWRGTVANMIIFGRSINQSIPNTYAQPVIMPVFSIEPASDLCRKHVQLPLLSTTMIFYSCNKILHIPVCNWHIYMYMYAHTSFVSSPPSLPFCRTLTNAGNAFSLDVSCLHREPLSAVSKEIKLR